MGEFRNLKTRIEELESDLRERDDEVKVLKEQALQQQSNQMSNGADSGSGGDNGYKVRQSVSPQPPNHLVFYGIEILRGFIFLLFAQRSLSL